MLARRRHRLELSFEGAFTGGLHDPNAGPAGVAPLPPRRRQRSGRLQHQRAADIGIPFNGHQVVGRGAGQFGQRYGIGRVILHFQVTGNIECSGCHAAGQDAADQHAAPERASVAAVNVGEAGGNAAHRQAQGHTRGQYQIAENGVLVGVQLERCVGGHREVGVRQVNDARGGPRAAAVQIAHLRLGQCAIVDVKLVHQALVDLRRDGLAMSDGVVWPNDGIRERQARLAEYRHGVLVQHGIPVRIDGGH